MSEENRPFKKRPQVNNTGGPAYEDDVYERDGEGRPVGFKRGPGSVVRRRAAGAGPPLKPYLILSGLFAGFLLLSGEPLYAGVVAAVMSLVYMVSRWRR